MLKQILFMLLCFSSLTVSSQSLWEKAELSDFRDAAEEDKFILPKAYHSYTLSYDDLLIQLNNVPREEEKRAGVKGKMISLPTADGGFETFEVWDAPVMAPGLASRYPNIKSFKGVSTISKSKNVRFDVGSYGFHAAIHGVHGVEYIDPYARGNKTEYLVYNVKDHHVELDVPFCGVEDKMKNIHFDDVMQTRSALEPIPMRVYRFALACTGEWGNLRGTVENALADMVTGVNRMNQIFENELALRLVLIEDNDKLINLDAATDPYNSVASGGNMLGVNTAILNNTVGSNAYNIGHVYHRACDVGGIAALGSMCNNGSKGAGVTCHYSNNLDFMAASVTSHEVGHQMSAQHTFNNCDGENESLGNGYEPGSGSTIMSYGGLCGPARNVQNFSDDNYHVASLIQIYNHTRDGGNADACAEKIPTDNEEPQISIEYDDLFAIPEDTYFFLEGSATDANNDELTYSWEGFNSGPLSPLGSPIGEAPRFRVFPPSQKAIRYFPSADNVINLSFDRTEVLPQGNMTLNFMFVVRDNNPDAGTSVWEQIRLRSIATPEKFDVTSQNESLNNLDVGDEIEVTWNVANTDQAPINTQNVDILLSTASASEFDLYNMTVLASKVPNTGSARVYIPNDITTKGRIIVRAHDNVFFAINKRNVVVKEPESPSIFFTNNPSVISACLPTISEVELTTEGLAGIEGNVSFSVVGGLPTGAEAAFDSESADIGSTTMMTIDYAENTPSGEYEVEVQAVVEGVDTFTRIITVYALDSTHDEIEALGPVDGAGDVGVAPTFSWVPSPNADSYTIEVASSPVFGSSTLFSESGITDTSFDSPQILEKKTLYYWRIIPRNACEEGKPIVFAFNTEVLACAEFTPRTEDLPLNISQSGTPTEAVDIEVDGGSIADVNILRFVGEHDNNKDMVVTLISPAGTRARLFSKICNQSDFNCTFDDSSNEAVKCPLNAAGKTYRPKDKFDVFNGETAQGTWVLEIDDTSSGNGGRLEDLIIEVCASQSVKSPYIEKNELLALPWGGNPTITSALLRVKDDDNSSDELIYTIVSLPVKGELSFNGGAVSIGDQFTQKEVNENKLKYTGGNEDYQTFFSFTVIDGEGGFLGITNFDIDVSNLNSTFDPLVAEGISVFPVPTREYISIDLTSSEEEFTSYEIVNISGQTVLRNQISSKSITLDVSNLSSGIYFINIKNDNYSIPKRIIVE